MEIPTALTSLAEMHPELEWQEIAAALVVALEDRGLEAPPVQPSAGREPSGIIAFLHSAEFVSKLPGQDSNLDKENQNLLCYRYTTG